MDAGGRDKQHLHLALAAFIPLVSLPLTWWLAFRALRERQLGGLAGILAASRLFALAAVDTLLALLVIATTVVARPAPLAPPIPRPEPRSPFEPVAGVECSELWRDQALWILWPVVLACLVTLGLWWRARALEANRTPRWGIVLVVFVTAPLVGILAAYGSCTRLGGWSVGVGLLGMLAQGIAMLGLGAAGMSIAAPELRVVVGPQLSASKTSTLAVVYMFAGLARAALFIVAMWTLVPDLRSASDPGIETLLMGERGWLGRALMLAAAVVVAPAAEEVVFRGLLLPGLAQRMSTGAALFWSSALFALFHVPSHGLAAVAPGVLGLVFGWARLRSGGLAAPILLHAANNLVVTALAWAS